jgi:hypothetical protein
VDPDSYIHFSEGTMDGKTEHHFRRGQRKANELSILLYPFENAQQVSLGDEVSWVQVEAPSPLIRFAKMDLDALIVSQVAATFDYIFCFCTMEPKILKRYILLPSIIIHISTEAAYNLGFITMQHVQQHSRTWHTHWLHTGYIPDASSCIPYQFC